MDASDKTRVIIPRIILPLPLLPLLDFIDPYPLAVDDDMILYLRLIFFICS
jgi:hypothetical protein